MSRDDGCHGDVDDDDEMIVVMATTTTMMMFDHLIKANLSLTRLNIQVHDHHYVGA